MSYILLSIGFLATIIALMDKEPSNKEDKSVDNNKEESLSLRKIALVLASLALFFGIIKQCSENRSDKRKTQLLDNLNIQIDSSNMQLSIMKLNISAYKEVLYEISSESERQPQWTSLNYFTLEPNQETQMPNKVHSGSLIKFIGICDKLVIRYGNREIEVPKFNFSDHIEIAIAGPSGKSYSWSIENLGEEECGTKIYVLSTPRSRSNKWSYEEEKN